MSNTPMSEKKRCRIALHQLRRGRKAKDLSVVDGVLAVREYLFWDGYDFQRTKSKKGAFWRAALYKFRNPGVYVLPGTNTTTFTIEEQS